MWRRIASVLILGYLSLSRAFAYLGIPAWKVFVSEVVLGFLLLCGPRLETRRWLWVVLKMPNLRRFMTWYGLFLAYGVMQVFRGIWQGNPPLIAVRDLAFIFYLNRLEWFVPGFSAEVVPVSIFGQPIYSFVALLGLLAYEKRVGRSWYLLLLNGFVMLGMQIRSEWLAFAIGVVIWCVLTRQAKRFLQASAILASLLALMYITDFSLPSPKGRAEGDFSSKQLTDRAMAVFRADLSDESAAAGLGGVDSQEATFVFRTVWWLAIWNSAHSDFRTAVWGHGYGFPLGDLVPYLEGEFIRTPHNEFFYALGYTGWIGVLLFALFQIEIFRLLWNAYRVDGRPFGIIFWAAMMVFGMFFPLGETPYGAIPFYLVIGWCASPLLAHESNESRGTLRPSARFLGMNPSSATVVAS